MGIRETINRHQSIVTAVTIAVIIVTVVFMVLNLRRTVPKYGTAAFYSDDDGASYFEESNTLIAPFDHNGKQAYRAYVVTCDNGKTKWVAYLHGYLPDARKKMVEIRELMEKRAKEGNSSPPPADQDPMYVIPRINRTGLVFKQPDKPGQPPNKWTCEADGASFAKARQVTCPSGQEPADVLLLP